MSHVIPLLEELKRQAYCKWYNSFSHATNDCNIFRRRVQSAVSEGRLEMHEMQVDEVSLPVHNIDLDNVKVLIRPEQAEGAKGKNVIIGEPRPKNVNDKILAREVTLEKVPDGRELLKITVKASRPRGKRVTRETRVGLLSRHDWSDRSPLRVSQKADPKLSSLRARKLVLGRLMNQRCRKRLRSGNLPLINY